MRKSNIPYSFFIVLSVLIVFLIGIFHSEYQKEQDYCKLYLSKKLPQIYPKLDCYKILNPKELSDILNASNDIKWD